MLRIYIKSPKEKRIGTGVKLEIFGNCTFCCPVKAWEKWRKWGHTKRQTETNAKKP